MQLLNRWKKLNPNIALLLAIIMIGLIIGLVIELKERYTINELLAVASYVFLVVSMTQEDIIKLRVYGACAGMCFVIQFALSDLPIINVIGQTGLVIYGLYKAFEEIKIKKEKA